MCYGQLRRAFTIDLKISRYKQLENICIELIVFAK